MANTARRTPASDDPIHLHANSRSRCMTIRSVTLPSHFSGITLFPLPCHQSRQRGRQFARIGPNQLIRPHRDGLGTLGVVIQGQNWLVTQVCLVYLYEPDEPTHEEDDLLRKNLTN